MAKRVADKELTDRNWDQEEEAEDAGTFSLASQDVLKSREIKKAKRRNLGSESETGGAFKGFKGLFGLPSGAAAESGVKPAHGFTNGNGSTSLFSSSKPAVEIKPSFGSLFTNGPSSVTDGTSSAASFNGERPSSTSSFSSKNDYNKQLTALNCSVRDWIVKHVNTNPLCDLSPIFRDYEKHLVSIEQKYGGSTDSGSESDNSKTTPTIPTFGSPKLEAKPAFHFTIKESKSEQTGQPTPEKTAPPASIFSFSSKSDTFGSGKAAGFSFTAGAVSLFGKDSNKGSTGAPSPSLQADSSSKNEDSAVTGGGEDEEEELPKVITQTVTEEDAFYSKKCKLFYKKDNEFKERGVGTLHLKPVGDQKTQLLIRADTNLGNIWVNIVISSLMPCSRTGKNNVMIVCVPNPSIDEKEPPVTMLIRVKTSEDADELHNIILEKKRALETNKSEGEANNSGL
ncbi:nuclear pore complex protein Nup50 isoform X2 [Pseudophryne corroboree]